MSGRDSSFLPIVRGTFHPPHSPARGAAYARLMDAPWLSAEPIRTARLLLEPLRVDHARQAATAFGDFALHEFIGGSPSSEEQLRSRYERQVVGQSADGTRMWLNWMVCRSTNMELVGTVQATVTHEEHGASAELAWVIATAGQGQGFAREAATAMADWLRTQRVGSLVAHVHPAHRASIGVARAVGMHRTATIVDGEERWTTD